jgi:hypothetical protein
VTTESVVDTQNLSSRLGAVTRRPRGVEPPAPGDYGTPDVRWHPSKDHDAVHVAALNLQHLVLCEIRRLVGEGSATDLSRLLGISLRTAQRIAAGDHLLKVDELVELACLFGDNVLEAIPHTVMGLFPEVYRPYLQAWRAGGRELPLFAQPAVPEAVVWVEPVADLCHWLADESQAGRIGLVNAWVFAHRLAECLADAEIPSSLIVTSRSDQAIGRWLTLDVLTRIPTRVLLCYLLDPVDEPVVTLRDTLSAFYAALAHEGQRVALLCLGQRMSGQLRVHAPALIAAQAGDVVTIPFQVAGKLRVRAAKEYGAPDLTLTVEASAVGGRDAHVLALSLGKTI